MSENADVLWFVAIDGVKLGPLSAIELSKLISEQKITHATLRVEGRARYLAFGG